MATPSSTSMGALSLRTAWAFQAVASFLAALSLGAGVASYLSSSYYLEVYRFIACVFNALFAGAILFITIVQWRLAKRGFLEQQTTFVCECAKALIATVMWLWLLLDSIFHWRYWYGNRGKRIAVSAISVILVLVLFWPTAIYAIYGRKTGTSEDQEPARQDEGNAAAGDETTPLLTGRA